MTPGEWWYNDTGQNLLQGVVGDLSNPALLDDASIINFLQYIPAARDSFERLVPQMLPAEQDRLRRLAETLAHNMAQDPMEVSDNFQHRFVTSGVRVCGPRGGGNWAPPPMDRGEHHA